MTNISTEDRLWGKLTISSGNYFTLGNILIKVFQIQLHLILRDSGRWNKQCTSLHHSLSQRYARS